MGRTGGAGDAGGKPRAGGGAREGPQDKGRVPLHQSS